MRPTKAVSADLWLKMMTYIISRLPEEYLNIIEIPESELYYEDNPLVIDKISDKILVKCDQMNKQSRPKMPIKNEKSLQLLELSPET